MILSIYRIEYNENILHPVCCDADVDASVRGAYINIAANIKNGPKLTIILGAVFVNMNFGDFCQCKKIYTPRRDEIQPRRG